MSAQTCPLVGCDVDHTGSEASFGDFHVVRGIDRVEEGVLRTDHVIEHGVPHLSIVESLAWSVTVDAAPEFFRTLRASVDEAERLFASFVQGIGRPLTRNTEAGAPDMRGVGGGL